MNSKSENAMLYPVKVDNKYGYINGHGEVVIKPRFSYAACFSEGLAIAYLNEKTYFIDSSGEIAFGCSFDCSAPGFHHNRCSCSHKGKWGYIDRNGKTIIEFKYEFADHFHFERAVVQQLNNGNTVSHLIDPSGDRIGPNWDTVFRFIDADGWAAVRKDQLWGYIDRTGNCVIEPCFDFCQSTNGGVAFAILDNRFGIIKKIAGDQYSFHELPPEIHKVGGWSEGLGSFMTSDERWGYLDLLGEVAIEPRFDEALYFSNGMASVSLDSVFDKQGCMVKAKCGYINRLGQLIVRNEYEMGDPFDEFGIACVYTNLRFGVAGRIGYIDTQGMHIWRLQG